MFHKSHDIIQNTLHTASSSYNSSEMKQLPPAVTMSAAADVHCLSPSVISSTELQSVCTSSEAVPIHAATDQQTHNDNTTSERLHCSATQSENIPNNLTNLYTRSLNAIYQCFLYFSSVSKFHFEMALQPIGICTDKSNFIRN